MAPDPFASYATLAGLNRGPAPTWSPPAGGFGRSAPSGVYAGAAGYGSGGPTTLDAFRTKRPPTPVELIDAVKAVAYSCIKLNAVGLSKVPLRLYAVRRPGQKAPRRSFRTATDKAQRRIRGGFERGFSTGLARSIDTHDEIDEVLDHDLLRAKERPNPYFDWPTFVMYLCASLDAIGQAFFFPSRPVGSDGLADPTWSANEFWPLQGQYVYPAKGSKDQLIEWWRYFGDSYHNKEIVRARWFSLRDPYLSGYAPLHACYEQTSLVDYYTASVEGVLRGGARPDLIVGPKSPDHPWGEAERERLDADINNKFVGNKKKVWVTDGSFDVHTLTYPLADLGGLTVSKEQRLLCANCFDVPISLLQSEDSNRATAQESTHQHQYYGLDPRCNLIAAAMTQQLAQPVDDRLFFYFDDPVSRDVERDAKVWGMKIADGRATINEARSDDGQPPVSWGDEPWIPGTLVQPSQAAEARELAAKQAEAQAQALAPEAGPSPGDDTPEPAPEADADAARSALLHARITSALDAIERSLDADRPDDDGTRGAGARDDGPWADGASPE